MTYEISTTQKLHYKIYNDNQVYSLDFNLEHLHISQLFKVKIYVLIDIFYRDFTPI